MQNKPTKSLYVQSINIRQKAKVDWLTNGNEEKKFFYAKMSNIKHKNDIGKLLDVNGAIVNKASRIEKNEIEYFTALYISIILIFTILIFQI